MRFRLERACLDIPYSLFSWQHPLSNLLGTRRLGAFHLTPGFVPETWKKNVTCEFIVCQPHKEATLPFYSSPSYALQSTHYLQYVISSNCYVILRNIFKLLKITQACFCTTIRSDRFLNYYGRCNGTQIFQESKISSTSDRQFITKITVHQFIHIQIGDAPTQKR